MSRQREYFRISVERPGLLRRNVDTADCEVLDMTEKGFQLRTQLAIAIGEMIRLDCRLDEHITFHCVLVVIYTRPPYVGGRILNISSEDQRRLICFIEQMIAAHLVGM